MKYYGEIRTGMSNACGVWPVDHFVLEMMQKRLIVTFRSSDVSIGAISSDIDRFLT